MSYQNADSILRQVGIRMPDLDIAASNDAFYDYLRSREHDDYAEQEKAANRAYLEGLRRDAVQILAEAAEDEGYDPGAILLVGEPTVEVSDVEEIVAEVVLNGTPGTLGVCRWYHHGTYDSPPDYGEEVTFKPFG